MAKKNAKAAQQRAKKKHQKAVARRKKAARLRPVMNEPLPMLSDATPEELAQDAIRALREGYARYAKSRNVAFYLAAHELGSLVDQLDEEMDVTTKLIGGGSTVWTRRRVAALSTEDIVSRLAALGIEASRDTFFQGATGRSAAVWAEAHWLPRLTAPTSIVEDFVLLAACELWKRWMGEITSTEQILERWLDGIDAHHALEHHDHDHGDHDHDHDHGEHAHDDPGHLEADLLLWEQLKPMLGEMPRERSAAEQWLGTPGLMSDWTSGVRDVAIDVAAEHPNLAKKALAILDQLADHFSESPDLRSSLSALRALL